MKLLTILMIMVFLTACSGNTPIYDPTETPPVVEVLPLEPATPQPTGEIIPPPTSRGVSENPYAPQPGDAGLNVGNVYLDSTELLILESFPIQINLFLSGNLPTPCNHLRVSVQEPDTENRIYVDIYSVSDPNAMCIQVLEPFDTTISLGSFPTGHYAVYVNGELIGEFDS